MILDKEKIIFVHIRKTGGTSIEHSFNHDADKKPSLKHCPIKYFKREYPKKFKEYFKFTVVRNPWDWLVSRYFWNRDRPDFPNHQKLFDYPFEEFIDRLYCNTTALGGGDIYKGETLNKNEPWLEEALKSQVSRISIEGEIAVDFIIRFENLQKDFDKACEMTGITKRKLPHKFKTKHKHYSAYYTPESKRMVEEKYYEDIVEFDYQFETPLF